MSDQVRCTSTQNTTFGLRSLITKNTTSLYQDNSLGKALTQRKKKRSLLGSAEFEVKACSGRLGRLQRWLSERAGYEKKTGTLAGSIESFFDLFRIMHNSAIKIQRSYRVYAAKRRLDAQMIENKRLEMLGQLRDNRKAGFELNFHVGLLPNIAAGKLQNLVRRFLFRKKIARLQEAYDYFQNERMYIAYALIRKTVYMHQAKEVIKWKLFKIHRIVRLAEIKEKLKVLEIKRLWKKGNFSYKLVMKRIRRFKRRLREKEAALAEPDAVPEPEPFVPDDDDSEEEAIREQRELARKQKVELAMISYKIPKEKPVLPSLVSPEQTATSPIPQEYQHLADRLFDKKGRPTFQVIPKEMSCKPRTSPQRMIKRNERSHIPRYMVDTASSKRNRQDFQPAVEKFPEVVVEKRAISTLMNPTRTHMLKKNRKIPIINTNLWRPSTVVKETYAFGLDNQTQKADRRIDTSQMPRPSRLRPLLMTPRPNIENQPVPPEPEIPASAQTPALSLTFQAALPEMSDIISHYQKPFTNHTKPRTAVFKARKS